MLRSDAREMGENPPSTVVIWKIRQHFTVFSQFTPTSSG
jgi:hypothetical protein